MRRVSVLGGIVLVVFTGVVVLLTILPRSTPGVWQLFALSGRVIFGDKIGHAGLFGGLLLVGYAALSRGFARIRALVLAAGAVFLLSMGTEVFQVFVSSRSASSMDLTANWLGILAAVTVIAAYHAARGYLFSHATLHVLI